MSGVTVQELNETAGTIADLRSAKAELSKKAKALNDELETAETKMIQLLESSDLKTYKSPFGTLTVAFRSSVKLPATEADWDLLFQWLKDTNQYDEVTLPSATLNRMFKTGMEDAIARGETEFKIPGVSGVTIEKDLRFSTG